MIKIGITGSMGSGKSAVSKIFTDIGVPVVSADDIVNSLRSPGNVVWQQVRSAWPGKYIKNDREIDTGKLKEDILKDSDFKKKLEDIIHPLVRTEIEKIFSVWESEGISPAAAEVPLLFEAGWENIFDIIVSAYASRDILIERIKKKLNSDKKEALLWLSMQLDQEEKKRRADYTVDTGKDIKKTKVDIEKIIKRIKEREKYENF
jgi:dephospho-CoA kinase